MNRVRVAAASLPAGRSGPPALRRRRHPARPFVPASARSRPGYRARRQEGSYEGNRIAGPVGGAVGGVVGAGVGGAVGAVEGVFGIPIAAIAAAAAIMTATIASTATGDVHRRHSGHALRAPE